MHLGQHCGAEVIGLNHFKANSGRTWFCVKLQRTQFSIYNVLKCATAAGATPVQISCNRLVI